MRSFGEEWAEGTGEFSGESGGEESSVDCSGDGCRVRDGGGDRYGEDGFDVFGVECSSGFVDEHDGGGRGAMVARRRAREQGRVTSRRWSAWLVHAQLGSAASMMTCRSGRVLR